MNDLGYPIAYEVLKQGTPVFSSDGQQIGTVEHVLADEREDIFDGIVIKRAVGHGHVFAYADQVAAIHERGVTLNLDAAASAELPEPTPNPGVMREDPGDRPTGHLRRAWDRISGNY